MKKHLLFCFLITVTLNCLAVEKEYIWPKGKMPDTQPAQIAAMTDVSLADGFNPDKYRRPYLEWYGKPANANGACMILISGGGYFSCCDVQHIENWRKALEKEGIQCVNFVYRTPRPEGLPIYQTAWEDGQRAVRMVRSEAEKRGFDPEKIGTISMSAGSHLALLLATSSQTPAYERVDALDDVPCHINWAIVNSPAYITTDGDSGTPATRDGYGIDVRLTSALKFDSKTCPMSLHHGGQDPYSPNGSTLVYRELRKMGVPAELHLYPNKGHAPLGLERGIEFLHQMGFLGDVATEVDLMDRYASDDARSEKVVEDIWPEGRMPDVQDGQCKPYIEWHFPKVQKTRAIQIIYSGGAYIGNSPDDFEVAPARRYLNELGMTVVTLKYRTPRPSAESGLVKHTTAWQDLQRAVRIVRSEAAGRGLDPDNIGIMGSSAGGHLTLMGVTSSRHNSYEPIDDIDKVSCKVQWGIGVYPAYALTDGADGHNVNGGNTDADVLVPEFSFDLDTAPMLLLHGDADGYASMASVKVWEKMRSIGIQCELHTFALRDHCFQHTASPGTGSYGFLERIGEYLAPKFPAETELKFYDVKENAFPLANHGFDDAVGYYGRLSSSLEGKVRDMVWYLAQNNAGVAVRFRSNAKSIGVRWTVINEFRMNHMAPTGICGCDLYGYDRDEWKYVGTAIPRGKETTATFKSNIDGQMRDYVIFLPLYDGVSDISIGVNSDAVIEIPSVDDGNLFLGKAQKPIVFFGHSGCQGGCASRPGMLYTNILSRMLKRECVNLGFSGLGQMYSIMAKEMVKIDASAYVLDCLGNNYLSMVRDSSEVFIRTILEARPSVPLYLMSGYANVSEWAGTDPESEGPKKERFWIELCDRLRAEGYKNLYYINMHGPRNNPDNLLDGSSAFGSTEGTVDGGHLTDLGFLQIAEFLYPFFKDLN